MAQALSSREPRVAEVAMDQRLKVGCRSTLNSFAKGQISFGNGEEFHLVGFPAE